MEKLRKTAAALDTLFTVTYRICMTCSIIGIVIIAIFLILCLGAPGLFREVTGSLTASLDFGGISFRLAEGALPGGYSGAVYFLGSLILGVLDLIVYMGIFRSVRRILAPMKEGLPFHEEAADSFRRLSILTIASGVLNIAAESLEQGTLVRALNLEALFINSSIEAVTTYSHFDFTFFITALILFGLSWVFRYGSELQQLSDETL